jgi:hypothetical protein
MRRSDVDRVRIEAFLNGGELASRAEWCRRRGVRLDSWPQHSATLCWVDLAVGRAVDLAIEQGRARTHTRALAIVCGAFGLDPASVARRWRRTDSPLSDEMSAHSQKHAVACKV